MGHKSEYDKLTEKVHSQARKAYGVDLVSFAIFGSVARGVARPESDIDLLIVAENLPSGRMKRIAEVEEKVENTIE